MCRYNVNLDSRNGNMAFHRWLLLFVLLFVVSVLAGCSFDGNQSDGTTERFSSVTTEAATESIKTEVNHSYDFAKEAATAENASGVEYVSNIVIVYFRDSASDEDVSNVTSKLGGSIVGQLDALNQYQFKVESKSYEELQALCEEIKQMNNVLNAHIDNVKKEDEAFYPNDGYSDPWNMDAPDGDNLGPEVINAPDAWSYAPAAKNVRVAVIDSGFDTSHPDMANFSLNPSSINPNAEMDHGTFVTGLIGAGFGNGIGIAGIAPNAVIEGFSVGGSRTSNNQIYDFVIQAVRNDDKVINISFGSSSQLNDSSCTYDYYNEGWSASLLISNLIDEGKDFLIVQSAGNGAKDQKGVDAVYNGMFCSITRENCYTEKHSYEEIMNHVIVVASADVVGMEVCLSDFSNRGSNVTLCAPGTGIYSLTPGGGYGYSDGTSFSAPLCSGAAAFVWGLNSYIGAKDIKFLLTESALIKVPDNPNPEAVTEAYPMLDVGNAAYMMPPPPEDGGNGDGEDQPAPSNKSVFYNFLKEGYQNADDYYNDMPIHFELDGNGNKKNDSGDIWYQYAINDFDGDGESELLIYKRMYTGYFDPGTIGDYGMLCMYEWNGSGVEQSGFCFFDGNITGDKIKFYNNGVISEYIDLAAPGYYNYYIFNKEILNRFGMSDGDSISYQPMDSDGISVTRIIISHLSVVDQTVISADDSYNEEKSITSGAEIHLTVYTADNSGIEAGTD